MSTFGKASFLLVSLLGIVSFSIAQAQWSGNPVQLTVSPARDLRPVWSPDGTRIAFYSDRSDNRDIWVMNADGSDQKQLTTDPADDARPAWSPDGKRLAFDSDRSGKHDIWVMNADGSDQRQLTTMPGENLFPSWSPDGTQVAFFSYEGGVNDIWVVGTDGNNLRRVTTGLADERRNQCTFSCHQPAWSPTGTRLAFHSDRSGVYSIWVVDADGGNLSQLTTDSTKDYYPSWTSDGEILFLSERFDHRGLWNDVLVMDPAGSNVRTLFTHVLHGGPLYWSPDGTKVAFHSQRSGNFDIFVANLYGTTMETVTTDVVTRETEATPSNLSTAALAWFLTTIALIIGLLSVVYLLRRPVR